MCVSVGWWGEGGLDDTVGWGNKIIANQHFLSSFCLLCPKMLRYSLQLAQVKYYKSEILLTQHQKKAMKFKLIEREAKHAKYTTSPIFSIGISKHSRKLLRM